jgi:hypothetical protein
MNQLLFRHTIHRVINPHEAFDFQKQVHIFWEGTQFAISPFSLINRELCSSIIDSGVAELTIVPYEGVPIILIQEVSLFYRRYESNMTLDSAARNKYFIRALIKSLDRRRRNNCSLAESLPRLSRVGEESAGRHSDSAEG